MDEKKSIAGKQYNPAFYESSSEVEKGLAITHEQASDTYMVGTIDGETQDSHDHSTDITRKQK
ncbi:YozQ family protein [Bacillus sp. DJP31]|uniref:YozQ family protein n=1 Tax=Bacillus sp. DJP31 TaxID=3409789 RepID=UPI003BB4A1CE